MGSVSLFGAAPRVTNIVLKEQFTGDGSDTTFQLTSSPGNCTFNKGSWAASHIQTAYPAHCTGTDKKPTYDSTVYLVRNRIGITSINSSGLVTLDNAPRDGVDFYVWYWYQLQPIDEIDTYREDFVASMEAEAAAYGDMITLDVSNFDGILSATDTTVQQAMETIDDHLHDGQTLECDGITSDGGAFSFTTSGTLTFSNTVNLSTCINAGVDTDKFLVLDASGNIDFRTGAEVATDIGAGAGGGNDVYVEEGDVARADSSGADLYIDFDDGDFDVGVVGNECNITLNDGGHVHDGATLQLDGVNSDGGAFAFTTTGKVTFSQSVNLDTVGTDQFEIGGNQALAMPVDNTNLVMMYLAGDSLTTGATGNVFIGYKSGEDTTTGDDNIALGRYALWTNILGNDNVAIGANTLEQNSSGSKNVAIGDGAMSSSEGGTSNFALGAYALQNCQGHSNLAVGAAGLQSLTTGSNNTSIGPNALHDLLTSSYNVGIGVNAGYGITSGIANVAIGRQPMRYGTNGGYNVAIGAYALYGVSGQRSDHTVAIGLYAARYAYSDGSIYIGYNTGLNNTGNYSVVIGQQAGESLTSGAGNILLGYKAGDVLTTGASNIIIGYDVDPSANNASNELNIGDALFGILDDGNIGVGGQTFDATARNIFQIFNSTEPSGSLTDTVQFYEKDSSQGAGHGTLGLYTEEEVEVIGTFTPSHKLRIWHNGTEYHIQLDAV